MGAGPSEVRPKSVDGVWFGGINDEVIGDSMKIAEE